MANIYKRFSRSQKAAELRYKELESERHELYPLAYQSFPADETDSYPFERVTRTDVDTEVMSYVDELLLDEGTN